MSNQSESIYNQLIDMGYSEEDIAGILRDFSGEANLAGMMQMDAPQGYSAGGQFVAANPLQHIGSALGNLASFKMQQDLMGDKQDALLRYLRGGAGGPQLSGTQGMMVG